MIDETVKVTKAYLESHPEIAKNYWTSHKIISTETISGFLGWERSRVGFSLERLRLIGEGKIDKEAVSKLTTGYVVLQTQSMFFATGVANNAKPRNP